jgi:hypothetical protein
MWCAFLIFLPWMAGGEAHTVHFEEVGLKIVFPENWQIRTEGIGPLAAVAELPPRKAIATLARQKMAEGESPQKAIEEALAGIRGSFVKHEILKNEKAAFGKNLKGHVIMVRGTARDLNLRGLTYLFRGFGERFTLNFSLKEEDFSALVPALAEVANSLELMGPNPLNMKLIDLVQADETNYGAIEEVIAAGADINGVDANGFPVLGHAVFTRKGKLVKWLLENGADPRKPERVAGILPMAATPPIRELLKIHLLKNKPVETRKEPALREKSSAQPLEVQWRSTETQLFTGIKNGRLDYVREAVEKGADLQSTENDYKLPALELARQLVREFEELDLDATKWIAIERYLANLK